PFSQAPHTNPSPYIRPRRFRGSFTVPSAFSKPAKSQSAPLCGTSEKAAVEYTAEVRSFEALRRQPNSLGRRTSTHGDTPNNSTRQPGPLVLPFRRTLRRLRKARQLLP